VQPCSITKTIDTTYDKVGNVRTVKRPIRGATLLKTAADLNG